MGGPRQYGAEKMKSKRGKHLDDLKKELELDHHKIPITELYKRYNCSPTKVSTGRVFFLNIYKT